MAAIENEKIYGLKIRESANDGSDFGTPDADYRIAFLGEDGLWHVKDSSDVVTEPFTSGGGSGVELDYVQGTGGAPQTITAVTEETAQAAVTSGSVVYDGSTPVIIEAYFPIWSPMSGGANRDISCVLWDNTADVSLGIIAYHTCETANRAYVQLNAKRRLTPAAGARVYSIRFFCSVSGGQVYSGAGGAGNYAPGFIRITEA